MKCIFIYNPKSGKSKILKRLDYIKDNLEKSFSKVVLYESKSDADVVEMSKRSAEIYDVIIFSGGDGTFNAVVRGLATAKSRPKLGYIPSGTVNDIATSLKIPKNIKKALRIITNGYTIHHDIGKINDTFFTYVAGIGTFTGVSYQTKQDMKRIFGRLAYGFSGLKDLINPKLANVRIEAEEFSLNEATPLLLIMNSISVAGVKINKTGHLDDGMFDVLVVKRGVYKGLFNVIKLFLYSLIGIRRKKVIKHYRTNKLTVDINPDVIWTIDGESGPKGPVVIENIPRFLEIYVPRKK